MCLLLESSSNKQVNKKPKQKTNDYIQYPIVSLEPAADLNNISNATYIINDLSYVCVYLNYLFIYFLLFLFYFYYY